MINPCEKCHDEAYDVWDRCTTECPDLKEYIKIQEELIDTEE